MGGASKARLSGKMGLDKLGLDDMGIRRLKETEWCNFQLHSTFQCKVKGPQIMTSILVKTLTTIVHGFRPENDVDNNDFVRKGISRGPLRTHNSSLESATELKFSPCIRLLLRWPFRKYPF